MCAMAQYALAARAAKSSTVAAFALKVQQFVLQDPHFLQFIVHGYFLHRAICHITM